MISALPLEEIMDKYWAKRMEFRQANWDDLGQIHASAKVTLAEPKSEEYIQFSNMLELSTDDYNCKLMF